MTQKQINIPTKASFMATMAAVAWSFVGLRSAKTFKNNDAGLNPVYIVIAGLIGVAIFIAILITIVKTVVS